MANEKQIRLNIQGLEPLKKTLRDLPETLKKSGEKAVLRAGGAPIRKAAKRYAASSKDSGLLLKSIGLNVKTVKGVTSVRVGPRKGFEGKPKQVKSRKTGKIRTVTPNPIYYAHLVEFGTSRTAAKPFMRPAIDSTQGEVIDAMGKGLEKHLDRAARRLAKK